MKNQPEYSTSDLHGEPESLGAGLGPGQSMTRGQCITSPNGWYRLTLQTDGNLVLQTVHSGVALFTRGNPLAQKSEFRVDGNFVLTDQSGSSIFYETASYQNSPVSRLALMDDARLVIFLRGNPNPVRVNDFQKVEGETHIDSPGGSASRKVKNDSPVPVRINSGLILNTGGLGDLPVAPNQPTTVQTSESYKKADGSVLRISTGQLILNGGGDANSPPLMINHDGTITGP